MKDRVTNSHHIEEVRQLFMWKVGHSVLLHAPCAA